MKLRDSRWPVAALALLLGAAPAVAQQFVVDPPSGEVLVGQPLRIALTGLPARAEVAITACRVLQAGGEQRVYRAQARYLAGADGRIDLGAQPSLGGSYRGVDPRGLFWSMQPEPGAADPPQNCARDDGDIRLEASTADGGLRASRTVTLRSAATGLSWRDAPPFAGARMAWPAGSGPQQRLPAIIALGGSEGDAAILARAELLASYGYVVLGLPYYSPPRNGPGGPLPAAFPALPEAFAEIPVDRLEAARDWLAEQPEVDASRIALYGISKGAEFALIAASRMTWPKSVVAIAPSDVVWEGWGQGVERGQRASFSWYGRSLAFVPYVDFDREFEGFRTGEPVLMRRFHDKGRAAHPRQVTAARIGVEQYAGPMLLVAGGDDQVWDAAAMAQSIAQRRATAGRETVSLVYREAGHAISGTGWGPTTQYNSGPIKSGGHAEADARAQADAFAKTIEFLRRTLAAPAR